MSDATSVALHFAIALARREYAGAYAMTSSEYQRRTTLADMQAAFESIVPTDWPSVGPMEVVHTMDTWPDKQPGDVGWVYVSIAGDVYSEAVTVIVTREDGALKVRSVEWGRP